MVVIITIFFSFLLDECHNQVYLSFVLIGCKQNNKNQPCHLNGYFFTTKEGMLAKMM
jgi:hypothetical protein